MNDTQKAQAKKIAKIVGNVLLWIFLAFAFTMMVIAFTSISNEYGVPTVGKKVYLNVMSDSMKPTFEKGDMLVGTVLTADEKRDLQVGNIITFYVDLNGDGVKELNTHRIVSTDGSVFYTKGDNNAIGDGYAIAANDIVCTWKEGDTRVKGLGAFFAFLQGRVGFLCLVVIPLALFFIYEIIRFAVTLVKLKGKKKISAEEEEEIKRRAVEEYLRLQEEGKKPEQAEEGKAEE